MTELAQASFLGLAQELTALDEMRSKLIGSFAAGREDATANVAAATDDPDSLFSMLKADRNAPSSTSVAAVPASGITAQMQQELEDVMMLTSFISVAAMRHLRQTVYATSEPDITTPQGAATFVQAVANSKNFVLTSAMAGFLSLNTTSARSFSQSTTTADLHLEFLNTLFDGFNFPPSTITELDAVLTSVTQSIGNLKLSWSEQASTLDHMVFFYYFDSVQGLDDVKIAKVRLYFLHIDQASWQASVGKSSVEHFQFNMNFIDSIYDMDSSQTAANRDKIKALLQQLTGQDLDTLNQLLSPKVVKDAR